MSASDETRYEVSDEFGVDDELGVDDDLEIVATLRRCCAHRTPAIVSSVETPAAFPGYFTRLAGERLVVTVTLPGFEVFFQPAARCLVTFLARSRSYVFVSSVRSPSDDDHRGDLAVDRPTMLSKVEMRRFFRVPVSRSSDLTLTMRTDDGATWEVRCVDMSMAGMLVEFRQEHFPTLIVGDPLQIEVVYRGQPTTIHAEVRRRHGRRVGVFFPGTYEDGRLDPPDEIATMVRFLEREWRRKRMDQGYLE
jgi:hypothetical protein